jgi:hypothetical protein
MSVESQLDALVAVFVADMMELVRKTALEHAREQLGGEAPASTKRRAAKPTTPRRERRKESAPAAPSPAPAAPAEPAKVVEPWMRPLRPGVLETFDIRKRRKRGPKRKVEPARPPIPREPPVRALRVDGVTIIPSGDTDEAKPALAPQAEPAAPTAPAATGAEAARKWVVVRRPARDKQDTATGEGNGGESSSSG